MPKPRPPAVSLGHSTGPYTYCLPRLPPVLWAAALVARAAKLPFDTLPPLDFAVLLWIREAAAWVMGVLPFAMVIISCDW